MAFVSGLFLGLDLAVWHRAIHFIGAGLATVLGNTQVLFVGLVAWAIHRERPRAAVLAGVPVAFAGKALVTGLGRLDAYGVDPLKGTFFGLATGVTYAVFLLLFRASSRDHPSPVGPFLDVTVATAVACASIGWPAGTLQLTPSWPAHGWLAALAFGSQVVGWLLISYALPRLPAVETSLLLLLQPMATVLWATLLFAEHMSSLQWWGVALVLAGVGLPTIGAAAATSGRPRSDGRQEES
jgi:drug/metabolite transporter (DMT)-like permease